MASRKPDLLAPNPLANDAEFSVSEISGSLKRVVESNFSHVRVRGEVGRVTFHGNGHVYLDLKDDKAVLNGVVWKGSVRNLKIRPEQGLEVIATGRLTTFAGRSQYQMVIEQIEPAGVGALMALLEERRKKFAAEGLFAEERKRPLPFLPQVIGVVTSPTGAVIRDILHRLQDRFPRHVLLWPVVVQGDSAAGQVSAAINGFNALAPGGAVPRPDVLIVARGGGSIEDLWPFNEEVVVRAVAASTIPVISAVGHETDTTLIDYVADRRAPTPTAAAEMAVPVRSDLEASVLDLERRMVRCQSRMISDRRERLTALTRALPRAGDLVAQAQQRLDYASGRLAGALQQGTMKLRGRLDVLGARLRPESVNRQMERRGERLEDFTRRLKTSLQQNVDRQRAKLGALQLRPEPLRQRITRSAQDMTRAGERLTQGATRKITREKDRLTSLSKLMNSLSYQGTLARGFALVRGEDGHVLRSASSATPGSGITITFADGTADARITGAAEDTPAAHSETPKPTKKVVKPSEPKKPGGQGSLF